MESPKPGQLPPPPSKSSIKEANQHLRELHKTNCELEETIAEQKVLMAEQADMLTKMNTEVTYLKKQLSTSESKRQYLTIACSEKDKVISKLCKKCNVINEFVPSFEDFLTRLREAEETTLKDFVNPVVKIKASDSCLQNGVRRSSSKSFNITSNFSGSSDEDDFVDIKQN